MMKRWLSLLLALVLALTLAACAGRNAPPDPAPQPEQNEQTQPLPAPGAPSAAHGTRASRTRRPAAETVATALPPGFVAASQSNIAPGVTWQ